MGSASPKLIKSWFAFGLREKNANVTSYMARRGSVGQKQCEQIWFQTSIFIWLVLSLKWKIKMPNWKQKFLTIEEYCRYKLFRFIQKDLKLMKQLSRNVFQWNCRSLKNYWISYEQISRWKLFRKYYQCLVT